MLPNTYPAEIWLIILSFLSMVDVVHLSISCTYFYTITKDEKRKRRDIDKVLSNFVNNVSSFRSLMRKTEGYVAGDLATAFFTSPIDETLLLQDIDIIFCGVNRWMCLKSWFLFIRQEGFVVHESFSVLAVWNENIESVEFLLPSGRRFLLWFVREFQDDMPFERCCYIDWDVAGGTTFDNLQKEYQWRVCLLPPMCDGEIRDDELWDEAAETDYNRYLEDIFED